MILRRPPKRFTNGGGDYRVGAFPYSTRRERGQSPVNVNLGAVAETHGIFGKAAIDTDEIGGRELTIDSIPVDYLASKIVVEATGRPRWVTLKARNDAITISTQQTVVAGAGMVLDPGDTSLRFVLPAETRLYGIATTAGLSAQLSRRLEG